MFERFTDQSRRVLTLAQEEARQLSRDFVGTEHLLLGLLREGRNIAALQLRQASTSASSSVIIESSFRASPSKGAWTCPSTWPDLRQRWSLGSDPMTRTMQDGGSTYPRP